MQIQLKSLENTERFNLNDASAALIRLFQHTIKETLKSDNLCFYRELQGKRKPQHMLKSIRYFVHLLSGWSECY